MVSTVKTIGLALPLSKLLICNFYNVSSIKQFPCVIISRLNSFFNVFYVPSKLHYKPIPSNKEVPCAHREMQEKQLSQQETCNENRSQFVSQEICKLTNFTKEPLHFLGFLTPTNRFQSLKVHTFFSTLCVHKSKTMHQEKLYFCN